MHRDQTSTHDRAECDLQDGEDEDGEADLAVSREEVTADVGRLSLFNRLSD
jgi:hypothetical protein